MAALMVAGIEETLYYYAFRREHWVVCERTTRWKDCCVKCDEEPCGGSVFPMANQR